MDPSGTPPAEERENPPMLRWSEILVADDRPMVCRLIAAKLKRFCFKIGVVEVGLRAAAVQGSYSSSKPFELILMDSRTPNAAAYERSSLRWSPPICGLNTGPRCWAANA